MTVAAIICMENNDVSGQIADMLKAMSRNKKLFTVATDNEIVTTKNIESLGLTKSRMAIGHGCFSSSDIRFYTESTMNRNDPLFIALDGYILNSTSFSQHNDTPSDSYLIAKLIREKMKDHKGLGDATRSVLSVLRGAFSLIIMKQKTIVVARDIFGFTPLYWGNNQKYIAFASERKALWKIGINDISCFPPGFVFTVDGRTKTFVRVLSLVKPNLVDLSLDVAARRLAKTLNKIFFRNFRRDWEVGLLFSGGVDSSLIAKIFSKIGVKVTLYGVAVEGAYDIDIIERSASELGCKLRMRILALEEVEDYLCKTIYAVEEANVMKGCIGLPIYTAMETANSEGIKWVFSGQGADELFGGYSRYQRIVRMGSWKLYEELWNDLTHISETNLQRDGAIAMVNNIDYFLPYLDLEVVNFAMSLRANLKVKEPGDLMRKHVLREAAKILGLSESIAYLPKKAIQYSSGSDNAIRKISRLKGRLPREYFRYIFTKVFNEYYSTNVK